MSTSPTAILFDLDGTLIATRRLYMESLADALEPALGVRWTEEEILRHRPKAERRFLRDQVEPHSTDAVYERFYESYERRHETAFQGIYPGVPEMLAHLRTAGLPPGLVTGKSRRAWTITTARVHLGDFAVTVFDDDVPAPKPDPTGLLLAAERLGVEPGRAVYVGDSLSDLEAARRAGMASIGVLWSKKPHEVEPFRQTGQELGARIAAHPEEVAALVNR